MFFTNSSSAPVFASILSALFLSLFVSPVAAQEIDIGPIEVQGGRKVIPIQIASDHPEMKKIAETAFAAHGGYRLVRDRSAANFVFTFRPSGGNGVNLDISSGNPLRSQFQQNMSGASARNAVLRAADLAVLKTSGQPGFFAGRIAFVADRTGSKEIYISDLFLGEGRQMTRDGSDSLGPRWSPDGQKVLYTSYYRSGFPDIFQFDVNSGQRRPFVSVKGTNTGARFSPNGSQVAMVLSGEGTPEVYVSNSAGKQIRRLTRTKAVQSSPTWSPDGSRIAFTSDRDGRPQIFTMTSSGGNMSRVPTNISGNCTEPDWNHRDPNLLAFTAAVGGRFAVAVYDFSKRKSQFVVQGSGDAIAPCWTNDGRHLIYTARTASTSTLMLLDTHTGKTTPLSTSRMGKASHADFWIGR